MIAAQAIMRKQTDRKAANLQRMLSKKDMNAKSLSVVKKEEFGKVYSEQFKRNVQMRQSSVMLTDLSRLRDLDKHDFTNPYCDGGKFTLPEAQLSILFQDGCKLKKTSMTQLLLGQNNKNTLRILLGLALVNQQESLFAQIVR